MTASVRGPIAAATASGPSARVSSSMSTQTGVAPAATTALAVAAQVKLGTRTSPVMPAQTRLAKSAAAAEFTATACGTPWYAANSSSNASTWGPALSLAEYSASDAARASAPVMSGSAIGTRSVSSSGGRTPSLTAR